MRLRSSIAALVALLALAVSASAQTVRVGSPSGTGTQVRLSSGSGSPEGVRAGSPGDQYYCYSSCSGHFIWVKETGSGTNTGWVAHDASTGFLTASGTPTTGRFATWASASELTDVTAPAATALLDDCVGDSGSGGTKGLAPAPGSGDAAAGAFLKADCTWAVPAGGGGSGVHAVGIVVDGGGDDITTGTKGYAFVDGFSGTITKAAVYSTDESATACSIVWDVWLDAKANYPPTIADTITASAKPTLSSAAFAEDATLTSWTTSVSDGDVFGFNIDSTSGCTRIVLQLTIVE